MFSKNVSVWENESLAIIFQHCSTVTAANRVSLDKCQVSYQLITNPILSLLQLEWAKSYQVTLCEHNYQMSSVASFAWIWYWALYKTSVQFGTILFTFWKFIGAESHRKSWLLKAIKILLLCVVRDFNQFNLSNEFQRCYPYCICYCCKKHEELTLKTDQYTKRFLSSYLDKCKKCSF